MHIISRRPCLLEPVEALFRHYDGPVPAHSLEELLAGHDLDQWRRTAFSREVNRAARDLTGSISARRERLAGVPAREPQDDQVLAALSRRLSDFRDLGLCCVAENAHSAVGRRTGDSPSYRSRP